MADLVERLRYRADEMDRRLGTTGVQADLREAAAALEAAREDACVALVVDIRFACGDNGKRMQAELVEFIRGLAEDAERYRWLRSRVDWKRPGDESPWTTPSGVYLVATMVSAVYGNCDEQTDAAIDRARSTPPTAAPKQ